MGRIHPTKGVDLLLRVWKKIEPYHQGWFLKIAGPDNDGYLAKMIELKDHLGLCRVNFIGPVYGEEKNKTYQNADLFVLPTHTENFGVTVAEALANSVPSIVTKGAPWSGLVTNECGWWIDRNEASLFEAMNNAMTMSSAELSSMGKNGREWVKRDCSWEEIAKKMTSTYEWLLSRGVRPDWVRED
ncbi:hypothetical protein DSLASN_12250 [Desulfoluna limicola]|uniref:Glycosyl transferase family 1 domain-containing protein n=1 Tax=Desulfoluna limicola TaxID=2810562 RepID=A0ABM7PEU4_9BACT|nr:hypothetical protein DSLASN_12250 [Desulfoluna limicola]